MLAKQWVIQTIVSYRTAAFVQIMCSHSSGKLWSGEPWIGRRVSSVASPSTMRRQTDFSGYDQLLYHLRNLLFWWRPYVYSLVCSSTMTFKGGLRQKISTNCRVGLSLQMVRCEKPHSTTGRASFWVQEHVLWQDGVWMGLVLQEGAASEGDRLFRE